MAARTATDMGTRKCARVLGIVGACSAKTEKLS